MAKKSTVSRNFLDKHCCLGYTGVDKVSGSAGYPELLAKGLIQSLMALTSIIRLSVSEAARMFGISQRTVRRAIANQEITYVVVQGRYKINFESLLKWSQTTTTVRNKRDRAGIGQYVTQWKIKNKLYSPNPKTLSTEEEEKKLPNV